jgi:hypothetical protein
MPTEQILALLKAERDRLNRAIEALQGPTKRIDRPSKNQVPGIELDSTKPKRHVSAAARRKMAAAQKKRWAALKAAKTATNKPKTTRKSAQG